jgi:cytochrome c oxidase subunit II
MTGFPLFPEEASTVAGRVDGLYFFLIAVSLFFGLLIATLLVVFAIRYRRRSDDERPAAIQGSLALELTWTLIPAAILLFVFLWSADVFFTIHRVPRDAMEIYVVGKRWMWKVQHLTGQREMNELHVPVGVPVKLTLTSEDVIHSFFVPAFRMKKDAVPGRYNTIWFQATRPGRYHLFCAEYCGKNHSRMIGWVTVMEPADFQAWLGGGRSSAVSPAAAGRRLFQELACITCHREGAEGRGPRLEGLFGKTVKLASGDTVTADQAYIRESIVNPTARVVAGYQPIMPTFQGLVSEEGLIQLITYIQSLEAPEEKAPLPGAGAGPVASSDLAPPVRRP